MRLLTTIMLLLIVIIPLAADEDEVRPFAYVIANADGSEDFDMVVIDLNTGDTLYSETSDDYDCPNQVSPDGRFLHYSVGRSSASEHQGYLLELATGELHEIPEMAFFGFWSPDSKQIAYFSWKDETDAEVRLFVYDLETTQHSQIGAGREIPHPSWQDTDLHFISRFKNQVDISRWDGSSVTTSLSGYQLPDPNRYYHLYASPDAQSIILMTYMTRDEQDRNISAQMMLEVSQNSLTPLLLSPYFSIAVWNPDSARFVYADGDHNIVLFDVEHQTMEMIVRSNYKVLPIAWSSDGRYLSYRVNIPGGTSAPQLIFSAYDLDTGQIIQIADSVAPTWADIAWISNKEVVYSYAYSEDNPAKTTTDLYYFDVTTQERRQITDTPDVNERLTCAWG